MSILPNPRTPARAAAIAAAAVASALAASAPAGAAVEATLVDRVLTVAGDGADDQFSILLGVSGEAEIAVDLEGDKVIDEVFPGASIDIVVAEGRDGDDTIRSNANGPFPRSVHVLLRGGTGDDTLLGFGEQPEVLEGGSGADLLEGGPGVDDVNGGIGPDRVRWRSRDGGDRIVGGEGDDVFELEGNNADERFVIAPEGLESVSIRRSVAETDSFVAEQVETLELSASGASDQIVAEPGSGERIALDVDAGSGDDLVIGAEAADRLLGGAGSDTIAGGGGRDAIDGGPDADVISCGGEGGELLNRDPLDEIEVDCDVAGPADPLPADPSLPADGGGQGGGGPVALPPVDATPPVDDAGTGGPVDHGAPQLDEPVDPQAPRLDEPPTAVAPWASVAARGRRHTVVRLANPGPVATDVRVVVSERGPSGRRHGATTTARLQPGGSARLRVAVPRALRRELRRSLRRDGRARRRPLVTATELSTGRATQVRARAVLRRASAGAARTPSRG